MGLKEKLGEWGLQGRNQMDSESQGGGGEGRVVKSQAGFLNLKTTFFVLTMGEWIKLLLAAPNKRSAIYAG